MTPAPTAARHLALTALLAAPAAAFAHAGADGAAQHGLLAGLAHPFTGLDHLMAMLAVGFWSATRGARRAWVAAPAFVSMVIVGALLAQAGVVLPAIEPMIAASLLVIGVLVAARTRLPVSSMALVAGAFALFHGAAHGIELGGGAALAGLLVGSAALHLAGLGLGRGVMLATASRWAVRAAGSAAALLGSALLLQQAL